MKQILNSAVCTEKNDKIRDAIILHFILILANVLGDVMRKRTETFQSNSFKCLRHINSYNILHITQRNSFYNKEMKEKNL